STARRVNSTCALSCSTKRSISSFSGALAQLSSTRIRCSAGTRLSIAAIGDILTSVSVSDATIVRSKPRSCVHALTCVDVTGGRQTTAGKLPAKSVHCDTGRIQRQSNANTSADAPISVDKLQRQACTASLSETLGSYSWKLSTVERQVASSRPATT